MEEQEATQWHPVIQGILDEHLELLSGKRVKKSERESSRYVKIDYYCETQGELPTRGDREIIRPLSHLKARNVIEYKSWWESLSEDVLRLFNFANIITVMTYGVWFLCFNLKLPQNLKIFK